MKDAVERHLLVTTATDDESGVIVTVSDHGSGVAERDLQRIFEPFYTTKAHGLGMGLAIARSLVESHGGRLRVENNKNGGATFTFTIPVAEASGD
jgi:two-component system, LuxR family, sensor kinase FixL